MAKGEKEMREIGMRIEGLREACDVTREEMAEELEVSLEKYTRWEETGADVPISAIYHIACKFGVEFTEILTGTAAKLDTFQLVRKGQGREVERYPGYHFEDLAYHYAGKIMQPLEVTIDPSDAPAKLVTHSGQEFNLVLEGSVMVVWGDREFILNAGDSIYFNPQIPHGQRCASDVPCKFVTVIAE
ncbi:DNA-binding transcriptional repressor PuuR [Slackia heliotrinireducens]|jgi:transcriptional regulator with XRE-family HTH domain|uniref:Cupin domain-containing protein n=1 Tax=Slackia heliotrinireducens (strain ATCC 29202 / DSM 20476 / NCTC 11029 / RHS 1) TaxID=471855 RepID=C7N768_SLAHD|nr:cupin domain-containing protein [Slackia heliotrinireducens]ACV22753.1 cupin domain-containing protein [Slackia heliotrinireducens DSM 20476]VEH01412.1 DNA-binding transcriptional repressor PuuR [Slackia heliotrinireducens]